MEVALAGGGRAEEEPFIDWFRGEPAKKMPERLGSGVDCAEEAGWGGWLAAWAPGELCEGATLFWVPGGGVALRCDRLLRSGFSWGWRRSGQR